MAFFVGDKGYKAVVQMVVTYQHDIFLLPDLLYAFSSILVKNPVLMLLN